MIINKFCKNCYLRELGSCLVRFVIVWINILDIVVDHFYNIGLTLQVKFVLILMQLQTTERICNMDNMQSYIFPPLLFQVSFGTILRKSVFTKDQ